MKDEGMFKKTGRSVVKDENKILRKGPSIMSKQIRLTFSDSRTLSVQDQGNEWTSRKLDQSSNMSMLARIDDA